MKTFLLKKAEHLGRRVLQYSACTLEMAAGVALVPPDRGITLAAQSYPWRIRPGQTVRQPDCVVGIGKVGWRDALDSYTRRVRTWWKPPRVSRDYRNCYGYVVSHDFVGGAGAMLKLVRDGFGGDALSPPRPAERHQSGTGTGVDATGVGRL